MKLKLLILAFLGCIHLAIGQVSDGYSGWYKNYLIPEDVISDSFPSSQCPMASCFILSKRQIINGATINVELLKNARIIDLTNCKVLHYRELINKLASLPNLEYLNISNIRAEYDTFSLNNLYFPKLKWLSIANCGFSDLDESIENVPNLEFLNL